MPTCKARFVGTCFRCGTPIRIGQYIDWQRGTSNARHAACQTDEERAIAPFDVQLGRYVRPKHAVSERNDNVYVQAIRDWFRKTDTP